MKCFIVLIVCVLSAFQGKLVRLKNFGIIPVRFTFAILIKVFWFLRHSKQRVSIQCISVMRLTWTDWNIWNAQMWKIQRGKTWVPISVMWKGFERFERCERKFSVRFSYESPVHVSLIDASAWVLRLLTFQSNCVILTVFKITIIFRIHSDLNDVLNAFKALKKGIQTEILVPTFKLNLHKPTVNW